MLERIVAGVVIIGALLWGASILATPTEGSGAEDPSEATRPADPDPDADPSPIDPPEAVPDEEDDEEDPPEPEPAPERRRKGQKGDG